MRGLLMFCICISICFIMGCNQLTTILSDEDNTIIINSTKDLETDGGQVSEEYEKNNGHEDEQLEKYDFDSYPRLDKFQRGINFSGLEAPYEGQWGMTFHEDYFEAAKDAGFDHIRIPVKWSNKASLEPPYKINPAFFKRIDWAVNQALSRGLTAIINIHHYDEIMLDPDGHKERFLSLWAQIADHYKDYPNNLYFELLNEPVNRLYSTIWNEYISETIDSIRETNPSRVIIIGPVDANSPVRLSSLKVPKKDENIVVTFHYYSPFEFTHQGADWSAGASDIGVQWNGTQEEKAEITQTFERAVEWAEEQGVKLWLGEFGAYYKADMTSRARWTEYIVDEAERLDIAWCYFEFGCEFGAYDRNTEKWYPELYQAMKGR